MREGNAFRLVRESDKAKPPDPFATRERTAEKPSPPEEVSPLPFRRQPRGAPPQILVPAETVSALRFNLRTLFRVDRPGCYWLEITFDDLKAADGSPAKVATQFPVPPRAAPRIDRGC